MHQGWEEITDAAITHLLRTCLAKSAKDQAGEYLIMELMEINSSTCLFFAFAVQFHQKRKATKKVRCPKILRENAETLDNS